MSVLPVGIGSSGGYTIQNSLRFRSSASAGLARTFGSAGNAKTWTLSAWIKRGTLGTQQMILSSGVNGVAEDIIFFTSADKLEIQKSWTTLLVTNAVFRDPSAWMHLLIYSDTTQAAAGDRLRIYINGVEASYGTDNRAASLAQNSTWTYFNTARQHGLAYREAYSTLYLDGYLADLYWIDGYKTGSTVATYSDFGETNADGVWVPKKYTGTYGTNGFWLPFSDGTSATTLGYDQAGSNDWTPSGISIGPGVNTDWLVDSPTNNYATLNPLYKGTNVNPADANLKFTLTAANYHQGVTGTIFPTSGKWYAEVTWAAVTAGTTATAVCRNNGTMVTDPCAFQYTVDANSPTFRSYIVDGTKNTNTTTAAYGNSYTANDVVGIALDLDNGKVWFAKNGTWQASGDPAAGTNAAFTDITGSDGWTFGVSGYGSGGDNCHINFGQRPWAYSPPQGFKPLATSNLPTVAITNPRKHFDVATWTANVSNPTAGQKSISLGFQPDLIWSKNRDNAESHYFADVLRGFNDGSKWLRSNATAAEGVDAVGSSTAKYNPTSSGFDIIDTDYNTGEVYYNGRTYVGWAWKANGAGSSNTDGTITSTVSANTTAGFSVVTYSGGSTGTVGHGLGKTPALIIIKQRTGTADNWYVWHSTFTATEGIVLNQTGAKSTGIQWFNSTLPTSTVFSVKTGGFGTADSGSTYVAYVFAPIAGFSAMGSFVGTADGPFVFCGFSPRWLLIKNISRGDGFRQWILIDTARSPTNLASSEPVLFPNQSVIESDSSINYGTFTTNNAVDITANGFKVREGSTAAYTQVNVSGDTYIYAAFAEYPFGGSNIAPSPAR